MSGHSHAKTVKRTKDANAAKRGKVFSKIARLISISAKDSADPAMNSRLRQALDEAKKVNMPKENIERAIKRATGDIEGGQALEEVIFEALMPGGAALIIEGISDNKNRTLLEIRQILHKYNGKLANEGSLRWQFDKKGFIAIMPNNQANIKDKEGLELKAIEAGADDIKWYQEEAEEIMEIITKPEDLEKTKKALEVQGLIIDSSTLGWQAKEEITLPEKERESSEKLFSELDENEAVQEIYSNLAS